MMKKREKSYTLNAKRRQKHYLNHIEECRENNRKRYLEHWEQRKQYRMDNKEQLKIEAKIKRLKLKVEVLSYYSKEGFPKCQSCGFDNIKALSLDHINNDGAEQRKISGTKGGHAFYRWVKKNNFPEGLQCLCMNCQFIRIE